MSVNEPTRTSSEKSPEPDAQTPETNTSPDPSLQEPARQSNPEVEPGTSDSAVLGEPNRTPSKMGKPELPRSRPRSGGGSVWALAKYPDADLVYAHVTTVQSRSALVQVVKKRGSRDFYNLLVEAIKAGHYGPPSAGNEKPNLRMILPWAPKGNFVNSFDLTRPEDRKQVRDVIFPTLAKNPELKNDPESFPKAATQHRIKIEEALRKIRVMEAFGSASSSCSTACSGSSA